MDKHASALTGGGAGPTILHVNLNEFTGILFWNLEHYAANALPVLLWFAWHLALCFLGAEIDSLIML